VQSVGLVMRSTWCSQEVWQRGRLGAVSRFGNEVDLVRSGGLAPRLAWCGAVQSVGLVTRLAWCSQKVWHRGRLGAVQSVGLASRLAWCS